MEADRPGHRGPGDIPFAADWDGDGFDTLGLHRPGTATTFLRNTNSTGVADLTTRGTGMPVAGDFGPFPDPPPGPTRILSMVGKEGWGARPAETGRMTPHTITSLTVHHAAVRGPPPGHPNSVDGRPGTWMDRAGPIWPIT